MRRRQFISLLGGPAARGRWPRARNSRRLLTDVLPTRSGMLRSAIAICALENRNVGVAPVLQGDRVRKHIVLDRNAVEDALRCEGTAVHGDATNFNASAERGESP